MLDLAAQLLSAADATPETRAAEFDVLSHRLIPEGGRPMTPSVAAVAARRSTPAMATPQGSTPAAPAPTNPRVPTPPPGGSAPSGAALRDLLSVGIAGLAPLGEEHFAEPVHGEDDDVIPIDELLYRGKDALQRAISIGETLRHRRAAPDEDMLAELYDLLQLAAVE